MFKNDFIFSPHVGYKQAQRIIITTNLKKEEDDILYSTVEAWF